MRTKTDDKNDRTVFAPAFPGKRRNPSWRNFFRRAARSPRSGLSHRLLDKFQIILRNSEHTIHKSSAPVFFVFNKIEIINERLDVARPIRHWLEIYPNRKRAAVPNPV